MAQYRKIDVRIWNDKKFRQLDNTAKLVFLLLLTHPNMSMLGTLRGSKESLAYEINVTSDVMAHAMTDVISHGMAYVDDMGLIFIPNFLKYNAPTSPQSLVNWDAIIENLPECELKSFVCQRIFKYANEELSEKMRSKLSGEFWKLVKNHPDSDLDYGIPDGMEDTIQGGTSDGMPDGIMRTCERAPAPDTQHTTHNTHINTNKQQTEVSEAEEASADEGVCCVSSCEDNFFEDEVIDAPVKVQIEHAQLQNLDKIEDEKKPLSLVELITACKTFGIKLSRTPKTEAIANRKTVNVVVLRECVKAWKGTNTGTGYFIGILENASKDPNSILPHDKREKPELSAETITDKQAGYFASRLVKDASFQSTFGVGHQSFDTFIDQVTARLHDPEYFSEYKPWMQKLGFLN